MMAHEEHPFPFTRGLSALKKFVGILPKPIHHVNLVGNIEASDVKSRY